MRFLLVSMLVVYGFLAEAGPGLIGAPRSVLEKGLRQYRSADIPGASKLRGIGLIRTYYMVPGEMEMTVGYSRSRPQTAMFLVYTFYKADQYQVERELAPLLFKISLHIYPSESPAGWARVGDDPPVWTLTLGGRRRAIAGIMGNKMPVYSEEFLRLNKEALKFNGD